MIGEIFNTRMEVVQMTTNIQELHAIDMSTILMQAYDIGDMINSSEDVSTYLYWKSLVEESLEVKEIQSEFDRKKQLFEECERFGHYHPDYRQAKQDVLSVQDRLQNIEAYTQYKRAEENLDQLLYMVSDLVAKSVSDTIKVPSNKELSTSGGCSSGGSCSGKCS